MTSRPARHAWSVRLMVMGAIVATGVGDRPAAAHLDEYAVQLARLGLERVGASRVWVISDELLLRDQLQTVPDICRRITVARKHLNERIHVNRRLWAARPTFSSGRSSARANALGPVSPDQLGGQSEVRERLIQLIDDTGKLAIALTRITKLAAQLDSQYSSLATDPTVRESLQHVGNGHRLGPLRDYRATIRSVMREASPLVRTPWTTAYLVSGEMRFAMIVNDESQATFTWTDEPLPALIPASLVETLGLEVPADAVPRTIHVGSRRIDGHEFRIRRLRVGSRILRAVVAVALPPEAEDVGAMIGPRAFGSWSVHAQPAQLRLFFEPRAGSASGREVSSVADRTDSLTNGPPCGPVDDIGIPGRRDYAAHGGCETCAQ